jgi:hypothetical protein
MTINLAFGPVVSLIAGILILIVPRLLNYIVAIYLIVIGLSGLFGWGATHMRPAATILDPEPPAIAVATPRPQRVIGVVTRSSFGEAS